MSTKHLTILHANDLHGKLAFTVGKDMLIRGGISLTSGYVKKVRSAEDNVFFAISGDVLQEDILGSDYKGTNTVSLINYLSPDAISLGNHELDYGMAHLLIFNNCINAPIICSNIMVGHLSRCLFYPSMVYDINGIKILVLGVIPKAFLNKVLSDEFCNNMLEYRDTYDSLRAEIDKHKDEHIDLTIVMSHYGIEGDRILAEEIPDDIHVDLILGGHTHIDMDKEEVIKGIPIAQSSYGTTHIGRFDLEIDTDKGGISSYKWERVALTEETSEFDYGVDELADKVVFNKKKKTTTDKLCEFESVYEAKSRVLENDLGDLISDAFLEMYAPDFVILQSGSIRAKECGPVVTEKELAALFPFDGRFVNIELSGKEIIDAFDYLFSLKPDGSVMNGTFQYSRGFKLVADATDCWNKGCRVESISLNGEDIKEDKTYTVGMTKNAADSFLRYFGFTIAPERQKLVSLSTYNDLAKWMLSQDEPVKIHGRGRFIFNNFEG